MPIQVRQDLTVGDGPGDGRAVFVHHHRRYPHNVGARSCCIGRLDGVTGGAGYPFFLKWALFGHALGEIAGKQGDGVVATLAVAGELNALHVDEEIDIL